MFIAALFTKARKWKQPRCPSEDKWIRKFWYIYTMEYYSAIKKNTFESILMRWMKLEAILQSEVSQREKHQYSNINAYIWNLEKWWRWPYTRQRMRHIKRADFWTLWEKARVGWFERIAMKHVYYHIWNRSPVQVRCMKQGTHSWWTGTTQRDGMGRDNPEGGSGWGKHVYPWLIQVNLLQKLPQYCKGISLQLKWINNFFNGWYFKKKKHSYGIMLGWLFMGY